MSQLLTFEARYNVILLRRFGLFFQQTRTVLNRAQLAPANRTHNKVGFQWTLRSEVDPTTAGAGTVIKEHESPLSAERERAEPRLPTSVFESTSVVLSERECLLSVGNCQKNNNFLVQRRPMWGIRLWFVIKLFIMRLPSVLCHCPFHLLHCPCCKII